MKILVVRNDKIGDFMLAWPVFALLKHYLPECNITALVPRYTETLARRCPWIDEVLLDEQEGALALSSKFRRARFDAMLTLFSTGRVAVAGLLAGIPYRLAPATKLAQFFYNHRLTQRRSRSEKPEYAYNLDLACQLLSDLGALTSPCTTEERGNDYLPAAIERPLLNVPPVGSRGEFAAIHQLDETAAWVVIHPGSGGSANNLTLEQYAELASGLEAEGGVQFLISAGPGEERAAQQLRSDIIARGGRASLLASDTIDRLIDTLQWADLFISGSTGPLHIAAALNRPTAAFYPRHRSATPLRWQTLNAPHKRLAFTPPEDGPAEEVSRTDVAAATASISAFLRELQG